MENLTPTQLRVRRLKRVLRAKFHNLYWALKDIYDNKNVFIDIARPSSLLLLIKAFNHTRHERTARLWLEELKSEGYLSNLTHYYCQRSGSQGITVDTIGFTDKERAVLIYPKATVSYSELSISEVSVNQDSVKVVKAFKFNEPCIQLYNPTNKVVLVIMKSVKGH